MNGIEKAVTLIALVLFAGTAGALEVEGSPDQLMSDAIQAEDVELSRFGTYLAFYDASEGNTIRMVDAELTELWRRRLPFYWPGSIDSGSVIQFTPDEQRILFPGGRTSEDICLCDPATGDVIEVLRGHEEDVNVLALSGDGSLLISASYNELALWQAEGESYRLASIAEFEPSLKAAEFLPDGNRAVLSFTQGQERVIALYSTANETLTELDRFSFSDNNISHDIYQIALSPDGSLVAGGYRDRIYLLAVGEQALGPPAIIDSIPAGTTTSVAFAPDGEALFSGHFRFLHVWEETDSGWQEAAVIETQQPTINDLEIAATGEALYLASSADENAVARVALTGIRPSPIGRIAGQLNRPIPRSIATSITPEAAAEIVSGVDQSAFAERDMFETQQEYEQRIAAGRGALLAATFDRVEDHFAAERAPNAAATHDLLLRLDAEGSYDIDSGTYTIPVLNTTASVELDRDAARALFRNWESALLRLTRFSIGGTTDYADFRLMHPTNATEYPVSFTHNPFTGERLNMAGRTIAAVAAGPHITLRNLELFGIFPSLYQRYESDVPFGRMTVVNTGTGIVSDLSVRVGIPDVTRAARAVDLPASISAGQEVETGLFAPVAQQVLALDEGESATMEIEVSYRRGSQSVTEVVRRQIRVLGRNAIQWTDDRRVGAFVTVSDPGVIAWTGPLAAALPVEPTSVLSRNILYAMQLTSSIHEAGVRYVIDPNSAYESLSEDSGAVDYLRFPVETLATGAGDCDDLSVLAASLLESVGIATAFITTPGHIFVAFDTGIPPEEVARRFSSRDEIVIRDGRAWMPVETTVLAEGFTRAWQTGALQWRQASEEGVAGWFTTASAWQQFPPVGPSLGVTPPRIDIATVSGAVLADLARYRDLEMAPQLAELREQSRGKPESSVRNRVGVLYATYGLLEEAAAEFEAVLAQEENVPALVNLSNVLSISGNNEEALDVLERARRAEPENARVLLGLAFSYWEQGNQSEARDRYAAASRVSPTLARRFPLFGDQSSDGARASEAGTSSLFTEDWVEE